MNVHFIIVILAARYLRKTFNTKESSPLWDKVFIASMAVSAGLMVLSLLFRSTQPILSWLSYPLLFLILYPIYAVKALKSARSYLIALLPFVLISFITELTKAIDRTFY